MKTVLAFFLLGSLAAYGGSRVDSIMSRMTLKEKIGQLNLGGVGNPKVVGSAVGTDEAVSQGLIGSVGGGDPESARNVCRLALETMRVPVVPIIGYDVIHGYNTIFPIPLASSCSWNMDLIRQSARIAAVEATANGINWTFGPMVDISRDPRWGRVAEGAGEDPWLGSRIAEAMIQGFQGDDLSDPTTLLACVKHFGLYGASEAGRDYNTVSMDEVTARNYYFPTYKAAFEAGAGSGMSSFNVVNGVPATGNRWLLTDLLRGEWKWDGFIVSDAGAVGEMTQHGLGDEEAVAVRGINAGCDMDMSTSLYVLMLEDAVRKGLVSESTVDQACRRVLEAKEKLGLLDDPMKYWHDDSYAEKMLLRKEHLELARKLAAESVVLLKNEDGILPLAKNTKVAVAGPMADEKASLLGTWSYAGSLGIMHSPKEALERAGVKVVDDYEKSDVIIAMIGESKVMSGEARCLANPVLSADQKELLYGLKRYGKPVVVVIFSGRPLVIPEIDRDFPVIVEAWHGGTMAAEGLSDIMTGKVNPSGKLTMSWPYAVGQIPVYYNALPTGRPCGDFWATSKYMDVRNEPLYPFGYGLSYTSFDYSEPVLSKNVAKGEDDSVTVSVTVTNTGKRAGDEIVQLYIADPVAEISRPVKELKDFKKISLKPGEEKVVSFEITPDKLRYYNSSGTYDWDAGEFLIMTGPSSAETAVASLDWQK